VDSCYVPFFGRETKTPSGPAFLASATGAAIVTAFCWREDDGRYRLRFDDEVPVAPRVSEKRLLRPAVEEYTRRTEAAIRERPEQWVFNHDRWRSAKSKPSTGWDPSEE
jgi:KDO2-lipid IV(A) lauroyltransferase